jgi:menaquinone-specific isochorismate synthase
MTITTNQPAASLVYRGIQLTDEQCVRAVARASSQGYLIAHEQITLAGAGCAARLVLEHGYRSDEPAEALRFLRAIAPASDDHATAAVQPVLLAALPFDSAARAEIIIPEFSLFAPDKGDAVAVLVGTPERVEALAGELPLLSEPEPVLELPDAFDLSSVRSHAAFKQTVNDALAAIATGDFKKVVLAREVLVVANRPFVQGDLVGRLRALYPSCATFVIDGFLGASPELLVRREGAHVQCHPLAGTSGRTGDPEEDARRAALLFASEKERAEHRLVVDAITDQLRPFGDVQAPDEPHLLELRNVVHLATMISASLRGEQAALPSALELAVRLHPTPAVGGVPRREALAFIESHEGLSRDRYAGPVGYLTADGDGEFFVGIRSAMIEQNRARLIAGVGIVAGSDPAEELAETQLKLQALLSAAVRP